MQLNFVFNHALSKEQQQICQGFITQTICHHIPQSEYLDFLVSHRIIDIQSLEYLLTQTKAYQTHSACQGCGIYPLVYPNRVYHYNGYCPTCLEFIDKLPF